MSTIEHGLMWVERYVTALFSAVTGLAFGMYGVMVGGDIAAFIFSSLFILLSIVKARQQISQPR